MVTKAKEDIALMGHLLRRAGFCASYDQLEGYAARGYEATVEELLHPESQPAIEEDLLFRLNMGLQTRPAMPQGLTYWFYRMINTRCPLEEKMALFWHSVLCTGYAKIDHAKVMAVSIEVYRRWGLTNFQDILTETARDPGMIYYLDNCMSHKDAINENWGRELLELFSMGVGNYTEDDVKEAAKAFTGWSIAPTYAPFPYGRADNLEFFYDPTDHENGEKVFLGNQAKLNGEDIVDLICRQPATARFLARHLYNFFVADEPQVPSWQNTAPRDPQAIDALVKAYFDSHYDIRSVLRVLFNSDAFKQARFTKVKSPAEIVVSTVRLAKSFSFPEPQMFDVVKLSGYMGQELYNPPTVEGWHSGAEWIDSGTLVERVNFLSSQLGDTSKQGVREIVQRLRARDESLTPAQLVDGCLEQLGGVKVTGDTRKTLLEFASRGGPVKTAGEDFADKTAGLLGVIVATKEYQFN